MMRKRTGLKRSGSTSAFAAILLPAARLSTALPGRAHLVPSAWQVRLPVVAGVGASLFNIDLGPARRTIFAPTRVSRQGRERQGREIELPKP
jgi:hypothetical protein